jgi:hypothetical protein
MTCAEVPTAIAVAWLKAEPALDKVSGTSVFLGAEGAVLLPVTASGRYVLQGGS